MLESNYPPPNSIDSRIATERASMAFNVDLGLSFICEILYHFWVEYVKYWEGKPFGNLTNIYHSMRSLPHFRNIHIWGSHLSRLLNFNNVH